MLTRAALSTKNKVIKTAKVDYGKLSLRLHKKLRGKIALAPKAHLKTRTDWSTFYTPGVAAVSSHLAKHPNLYTLFRLKIISYRLKIITKHSKPL